MPNDLNSLRMRAERSGRHLSGAERLLEQPELEGAAVEMLQRALRHPRGTAERISIKVERVPRRNLLSACLPDLTNNPVASWEEGRSLALGALIRTGVSEAAACQALEHLAAGPSSRGGSMRGAMLVDADSGERLEKDQDRGVRVSRMDLAPETRQALKTRLRRYGLDNAHVIEALTLAGKVMMAPEIVAELCWSDDPDYQAGYVASRQLGYQRISLLKPLGDECGGRAFFVRAAGPALVQLCDWLETTPVIFEHCGRITVASEGAG